MCSPKTFDQSDILQNGIECQRVDCLIGQAVFANISVRTVDGLNERTLARSICSQHCKFGLNSLLDNMLLFNGSTYIKIEPCLTVVVVKSSTSKI